MRYIVIRPLLNVVYLNVHVRLDFKTLVAANLV